MDVLIYQLLEGWQTRLTTNFCPHGHKIKGEVFIFLYQKYKNKSKHPQKDEIRFNTHPVS